MNRKPQQRWAPQSGQTSRGAAVDLLEAVLGRGVPLDDAIERHPYLAALTERDRSFARNLTATTLRRLGQIDVLIERCLAEPLPKKLRIVRQIIRLGLCQLVFLQTPPHAAVATSVDLCRTRRQAAHAALVNAVLRRSAAEAGAIAAAQDAPRLNTPDWLWQGWARAYGKAAAAAIAAQHLIEAPLDLTPKGTPTAALISRLNATVLPTGSLRLTRHSAIPDLPGFAEGAWWVQDAAAALPARLLGDVRGRPVIDLCAAPGGKTAQLAAAGAEVTAVDHSATRLARLRANLLRLNLRAEVLEADARLWRPRVKADAVLLDVPCSATGTIRRHPDVVRLKRPESIPALAHLQRELAMHAVDMVKAGGVFVYCACSLDPEEGPAVIGHLLASRNDCERRPIDPGEVGNLNEMIDPAGDLRTLPCHWAAAGGLDGFYAARLRKRG